MRLLLSHSAERPPTGSSVRSNTPAPHAPPGPAEICTGRAISPLFSELLLLPALGGHRSPVLDHMPRCSENTLPESGACDAEIPNLRAALALVTEPLGAADTCQMSALCSRSRCWPSPAPLALSLPPGLWLWLPPPMLLISPSSVSVVSQWIYVVITAALEHTTWASSPLSPAPLLHLGGSGCPDPSLQV